MSMESGMRHGHIWFVLLWALLGAQACFLEANNDPLQGRKNDQDDGNDDDVQSDATTRRALQSESSADTNFNYTALDCRRYDPTYAQIERDLAIHKLLGTTFEATRCISSYLAVRRPFGMTAGFFGGRAYLLTRPHWKKLSHHAGLLLSYLHMLLHVEQTFGTAVPDVAFVLTTSDTPRYGVLMKFNSTPPEQHSPWLKPEPDFAPGPYPVLGFSKSDHYPDLLLVPIFHFHTKLYDNVSLGSIPLFNAIPWRSRLPVLFGRLSKYRTNRVAQDPYTYKRGLGGQEICSLDGKSCSLREHFIEQVVPKDPARLNVRYPGQVTMLHHAEYKYLLHMDGQGVSSRLDQLLAMGSLVFKQASGYYAYYYKSLLRDRHNIMEFWRVGPEELFEGLDWTAQYDQEAQQIAARGQEMAARYLTGNGRTCYWFRLLRGLGGALSYRPSLSQWPDALSLRQALRELEAKELGQQLLRIPWAP